MISYDQVLSRRVQEIKPSGIRRFFDLAAEMGNVISLGVGEPDFKTPWAVRKAGIASLERGKTWYSPNAGFAPLRQEISRYLERRFSLTYDWKEEILVTVGGSEGIDLTIRALVNPGDEVLVPQPSYVSYLPLAHLTGAQVKALPTYAQDGFRLTASTLREAITPKTKLLVLPYPNNPTGGIMECSHLEELAKVLENTNIMVLSDEIYAELTYGGKHVSPASIPGMRERTVVINVFSKAYAMTGWRLGYLAGPAPVVAQMTKIHQFSIMCAPTVSQLAAIEALQSCDGEIEAMVAQYDLRRKLLVESLDRLGLTCFSPKGAFYVFPSIAKSGLDSETFCERLLREERVAVIPGTAFGDWGEGHVRISYSYSIDHLVEALRRIEHFLGTLG